jgi:hypothetical protein
MPTKMTFAQQRIALALLIVATSAMCCASLVLLAPFDAFHIFYSSTQLPLAALSVTAFSLIAFLFVFAEFSFGYFVGFHFYLLILGYLWISTFSDLPYDHRGAEISAAVSGIVFLVPALLIRFPVPRLFSLSEAAFEKLLSGLLVFGAAVIVAAALYNFRIIWLSDIYSFREDINFPAPLSYLIGITSSALLPFAFAGFALRSAHWRAAMVLLLLFLFYPITLSKNAFFAPFWLVFVAVLSRSFGSRITVILSLALPLAVGIVLMTFFPEHAYPYSHVVNLRLFAIPSNALDVYNHFFAHHELTHFCQISFLKKLVACPYHEPLSVVMQETYRAGYLNASLFATEGVASVGRLYAPAVAFVCGLVMALGNGLSDGLPARLVLISSALFPLLLSNVPLTTVLLTHGAGVLFLLWYVMPRSVLPHEG